MLLALVLPMLALPLIAVHVGAHPLKLAAHAPRGEANQNAQILARSQPVANANGHSNGHATNGHADEAVPHYTPLGAVRVGVLLYTARDTTEEEKGRYLQHLSRILAVAPRSGIPAEQTLINSLEYHTMELSTLVRSAQTYYATHRLPEANGHSNGHATNGQINGNSPTAANGHPQTNGDPHFIHPEEVRAAVSSYHAATGGANGQHLQHLLSILTSGRVPPSGVEQEEQALMHSLIVYAVALKAAMRSASRYYGEHMLSLADVSEEAMNNFDGTHVR